MASHAVLPKRGTRDPASTQGDSTHDGCVDDDGYDPGQSSTSNQCSLAGDCDQDDSWMTQKDMALLKALSSNGGPVPGGPRNSHVQLPRLRRLSRAARPVKFIGEGAANAVFEIEDSGADSDLKGLLLRVSKVPSRNSPPTFKYVLQQKFYQASIKPILGEYAVHQELVILRSSGLVDKLNMLLQNIDSTRKEKFRGSFIGRSDWGFLVEDMRPQDPKEYVLIEFKPKWLSQSPSAPKTAIRCRQCAMELRNFVKDSSKDRMPPDQKPCPLTLLNKGIPAAASSPFRIAPQLAKEPNSDHFRKALESIANHPALHELKAQQELHDKLGPLFAKPSESFVLAMTLRDCTCFAQIHRLRQSIKIRMGDFDRKDPQVKFERWRLAEEELVDGGFYTAEWIRCNGSFYRSPTLCLLEHSVQSRNRQPHFLDLQVKGKQMEKLPNGNSTKSTAAKPMLADHDDVVVLQERLKPFKIKGSDPEMALHGNSGFN
ncbi:hypothetical protein HIM_08438 [Hirsutella minnesotensis 3608]|uniref:Inositol-pentakisphosphate 2-kinase n=1 Tax=Hirsutella minnesotensis 3608 TaxID=1043627 RepID=A0A0F7ZSY5_9HYPO|nr:hypothetical protein HIM_08438 [Hirsutella minnesotensis 3608]